MNELQIFNSPEFGEIRTIDENGKPLFCGSDVAKALGYSIPSKAVKTHCKGVSKMEVPTNGGAQQMLFISEGDLYRLITHSKLPAAEKFEKWVFDEVLPSIRKHGAYAVDQLLDNPDLAIKAFTALKEERDARKRLETENALQRQIIGELQPKANYVDRILKSKSLVNVTQIAKDYGMSGRTMNKLLHDLHVQYKQGGQWLLYSQHQSMGYTHSETIEIHHNSGFYETKMETKWTQKGRLFLYELLKNVEVLPVIERDNQKTA